MEIRIDGLNAAGSAVSKEMLGGNALIHRNPAGEAGTIDDAFASLGIGSVRYPGGSVTEQVFNVRDPDSLIMNYGEIDTDTDRTLKFSDFMKWAGEANLSVVFVIPTWGVLDRENGGIDRAEVSATLDFVRKLLDPSGPWAGVDVSALEIGNEYWGSGQMTSAQYGAVADALLPGIARIVSDYGLDTSLLVQIGETWGADFGPEGANADIQGWSAKLSAANQDIVSQLSPASLRAISGISHHPYATEKSLNNGEDMDFGSFSKDLATMLAPWREAGVDAPLAATEWNVKAITQEFGLQGAGSFLEVFSQLSLNGYEWADAWPVQLSSRFTLAGRPGEMKDTFTGAAFTMLSRLGGYTAMDTGLKIDGVEVNAWGRGTDDRVFHVISRSQDGVSIVFDASSVLRDGAGPSSVRILTYDPDTADGRDWREGGQADVPNHQDAGASPIFRDVPLGSGELRFDLAPGEIAEIVYGTVPDIFDPLGPAPDDTPPTDHAGPGGPTDPTDPVTPEDPESPDDEGEDGGGGGGSCFVMTAAYGSQSHPDVIALRSLRDEVLVRTMAGRMIVRAYWRVGPPLAARVSPSSLAGRACRRLVPAVLKLSGYGK